MRVVCIHNKNFVKVNVSGKTNPLSVKAGYGPAVSIQQYVQFAVCSSVL